MESSLLLVLAIIGVVMILAGVARMRSKKKHSWDEIDHSVLFTKVEHDADKVVVNDTVDVEDSARINEELVQTKMFADDSPEISTPELDSVVKKSIVNDEGSRSIGKNEPVKKASFFSKISNSPQKEVAQEPVISSRTYKTDAPDWVIVLNVTAPQGKVFEGRAVVEVAQSLGLKHGEMDIFHCLSVNKREPLFSMANMVKPGIFDMETIDELLTPGVSMFIQLPVLQDNAMTVFNSMLETAQTLAHELGGEVLDETRSVLTLSAIDNTREKIAEYNMKWLAGQSLGTVS